MLTLILCSLFFYFLGFLSCNLFYRAFKKEGFKLPKINLKHPLHPKVSLEVKSDISFISPSKLHQKEQFIKEIEQ